MDWMIVLLLAGGLFALVLGAELLVRGASRLAIALGVSPLVIGLTVVAFGTSSPELAVSAQSALRGNADIALGNVVGSNIFNVLLILGLSAVITPLVVHRQLVRLDVPLMIGLSVALLLVSLDGAIGRLEGGLFFLGLLAYVWYGIWQSRKEGQSVQDEYAQEYGSGKGNQQPSAIFNLALIVAGLALLVQGSYWLVSGAVSLAKFFQVSDLVIGLTIVAAGTSMPEVATSVMAAIKNERDIAVGNVVGSNIFNIMGVLGLSALVAPNGLAVSSSALVFDIPVMLVVALATLPVFFTGNLISRWEGGLFLLYYAAYLAYMVLDATGNLQERDLLTNGMLWFAIPVTVITLAITVLRQFKRLPKKM